MRRTSLAVAVLLACAAPLAAQDASTATNDLATRQTAVVFTVQGRLSGPFEVTGLPVELVTRLYRDPALATLTIGPPSNVAGLALARFVFPDEAAFRAWYSLPETREMLRTVEATLVESTYGFTLKRYPAANLAEGAQATP